MKSQATLTFMTSFNYGLPKEKLKLGSSHKQFIIKSRQVVQYQSIEELKIFNSIVKNWIVKRKKDRGFIIVAFTKDWTT